MRQLNFQFSIFNFQFVVASADVMRQLNFQFSIFNFQFSICRDAHVPGFTKTIPCQNGLHQIEPPTSERFLNSYFIFTFLLLQAVCQRISRVNKDCFYFTLFHSSEKQKNINFVLLDEESKTADKLLQNKRGTFRL